MKLIVKLKGGFANQCIQLVFAHSISEVTNRELFIDDSDYRCSNLLQRLAGNTIQPSIFGKKPPSYVKFHRSLVSGYLPFMSSLDCYSDNCALTDILNSKSKTVFLNGYWHDSEFIDSFSQSAFSKVLDLFEGMELSSLSRETLSFIRSHERVTAVHVRRGDYLVGKYKDIYGVCPLSYYLEANELIQTQGSNAIVLFSDDTRWTEVNLAPHFENCYISRSREPLEDFYLMTCCDDFVISNSSFSWLAANTSSTRENKVIVSPKYWFLDKGRKGLPLGNMKLIDVELKCD